MLSFAFIISINKKSYKSFISYMPLYASTFFEHKIYFLVMVLSLVFSTVSGTQHSLNNLLRFKIPLFIEIAILSNFPLLKLVCNGWNWWYLLLFLCVCDDVSVQASLTSSFYTLCYGCSYMWLIFSNRLLAFEWSAWNM